MWLKRRTPQNIVIGGAAGAFPPVIGWAAVTGGRLAGRWCCSRIVFFWTPPHFWSLALFAHGDYQRAGVPMLPVVAGARETRRQMLLYTLVLWPLSLAPALLACDRLDLRRSRRVVLSALFTLLAVPRPARSTDRRAAPADVRLLDPLSVPAVLLMALDRAPGLVSGLAPVFGA